MSCADPHCPCRQFEKRPERPGIPGLQCSLNEPLAMVIPYPGVHITCPVHGQHWIRSSSTTFLLHEGLLK